MPLSTEQNTILRTWVGDEPTEGELVALYDIHGSWDEVIRSTLRRKISLLSEQPSSLSVPGLSISVGQQLISVQQLLKDFNNGGGSGLDEASVLGMSIGKLVRTNSGR